MRTSYETMQCNGKLYNVHDILSLFCDFDFDLIFFGKHRLIVLLKKAIIHATSSYLLQISSRTPSECMPCLIYSLDNFGVMVMESFNHSIEIPGFVTFFFCLKTSTGEKF